MRKTTTLVIAALAATTLLTLVVGEASARSFSVDEKNFELIWDTVFSGKTKLSFTDSSRRQIRCKVTLLGSFLERTIPKLRRKIATINHGTVNTCEGGTAEANGFPWEVSYQSFTGTLPAITAITVAIVGERWRMESGGGITCEFSTEARNPAIDIIEAFNANGAPRNIRAEERTTIPFEGFTCAFVSPGTFEGVGLILNLPTNERIFITLI